MTTPQILLIAAAGLSVVVGFIMKMPAADRRAARKRIAATDWLDDDSADGAQVKVTGVVKVRDHGERFVSPLSETRCVVQRIRVLVRRGQDPRAKLIQDLKIMPFVVERDGERVLVDAAHAILDVAPMPPSKAAQPLKAQLLTQLGHEGANAAKSEFEETVVELGKTVTVVGTFVKADNKITGTLENPIAIRIERVLSSVEDEP